MACNIRAFLRTARKAPSNSHEPTAYHPGACRTSKDQGFPQRRKFLRAIAMDTTFDSKGVCSVLPIKLHCTVPGIAGKVGSGAGRVRADAEV